MQILAENEESTLRAAAELARRFHGREQIMLHGPLGSGKTVFARALIRILTGRPDMEVPSPTFTLCQTYETDKGLLWHFDLYRLEDPEEIYELGWEEAHASGMVIVEWPERLGSLLPRKRTDITLLAVKEQPQARIITIEEKI